MGEKLSPEQAAKVLGSVVGFATKLTGNALLCQIGGTITETVGDTAAEVLEVVVSVLGGVAAHLPYISMAAGILGGIYEAFRQSKLEDENVRNCLLWCRSIVDWLMLVANRVDKSGAESSVALFQELQKAMQSLKSACIGFQNHWLVKRFMVHSHTANSPSFEQRFTRPVLHTSLSIRLPAHDPHPTHAPHTPTNSTGVSPRWWLARHSTRS